MVYFSGGECEAGDDAGAGERVGERDGCLCEFLAHVVYGGVYVME